MKLDLSFAPSVCLSAVCVCVCNGLDGLELLTDLWRRVCVGTSFAFEVVSDCQSIRCSAEYISSSSRKAKEKESDPFFARALLSLSLRECVGGFE